MKIRACRVRELDHRTVKPLRAGIIVYDRSGEDLVFCLGIDHASEEYTDFGGGVNYRKDADAISGALREFQEESLGVFGKIKKEDLQDCYSIYSDRTLIIFLPLSVIPEEIDQKFEKSVSKARYPEVVRLQWVGREEYERLLTRRGEGSGNFYKRVRDLLEETPLYLSHL